MMHLKKKKEKKIIRCRIQVYKQRRKIDLMDDDILLDEKCQIRPNLSREDRFNFSSIRFDDIIVRFSGHEKLTIIMNSKWFTGNHCYTGSTVIYYDLVRFKLTKC